MPHVMWTKPFVQVADAEDSSKAAEISWPLLPQRSKVLHPN